MCGTKNEQREVGSLISSERYELYNVDLSFVSLYLALISNAPRAVQQEGGILSVRLVVLLWQLGGASFGRRACLAFGVSRRSCATLATI